MALTVGFALIGVVLWGCLAGSMLPLLLRRCGTRSRDLLGAVCRHPVDVTGLLIYFNVALLILRGTLL